MMINKYLFPLLLIGFGLLSCSQDEASKKQPARMDCDELVEHADYMTLTGTLVINPKGELVFKAITDDSLGIACSTFLIPCGDGNNEYIEGQYIGYSSIRNINDNFWISVSGKYVNLDHYKNQDEHFKQLEFVYTNVALIDAVEAD